MTCVADMYEFPDETAGGSLRRACANGSARSDSASYPTGCPTASVHAIPEARMERRRRATCWRTLAFIPGNTLTDEAFCRPLAAANKSGAGGAPLHRTLVGTEKEHRELLRVRHGKTPVAYLADTGLLDCAAMRAWRLVHGRRFPIMAEKGVSLVHNPSAT